MLRAFKLPITEEIKVSILVDTNVFLDVFDTASHNHEDADNFMQYVTKKGILFQMPELAWLEMTRNLKKMVESEDRREHIIMPLFNGLPQLPIQFFHLNENYEKNYKDVEVSRIKFADNVFLVIAKKDNLQLITSDKQMIKAAKESKIDVYTPGEWMNKYGK